MKIQKAISPFLLALILALGITAAWVTVVLATSAVWAVDILRLPEDSPNLAEFNSILLPSPIELAISQFFYQPLKQSVQSNRSETQPSDYSYHLYQMLNASLPSFTVVCLLSVILSAWCSRRHRRFDEHSATAWVAFVFVMGAPGLIGYLLHRRWPVMERCQHCGKESPRDRDACLHCAAEFPLPAMKGIEIFA